MSANRFRILIVDDDFSSRRLLARIISSQWPVHILEAQEGSEALRIIVRERPDLIILDMVMPFMNGVETLKTMRENAKMADIPVIACTSIDEKGMVADILKLGVEDYIVKPFERTILVKKLKRFVEASKV